MSNQAKMGLTWNSPMQQAHNAAAPLQQAEKQEPVAWMHDSHVGFNVPLYTAPQKKKWVGLTDEEVREFEVWLDNDEEQHGWNPPENIVKYLEAKLKEKNNGNG